MKKNIVLALLAHVDAGKTTMSEALLYKSGKIKNRGRVDHKNTYLDNFPIERQRGITVFSKQAVFDTDELHINLLDTPGHMDFSAELERTLSVLDYAVLLISASDGIQAHTLTLWELLKCYRIPTVVWINKMDAASKDASELTAELERHFGKGFSDMSSAEIDYEKLAELDDDAMELFFACADGGADMSDAFTPLIQDMIVQRKLFPCYFGSALKLEGIDELIKGFDKYMKPRSYGQGFGARVYKISRADDGQRLTWIKLTGGSLSTRAVIDGEKITQIRVYSGAGFEAAESAEPGNIYALCGLSKSFAGQGLGYERSLEQPLLAPVFSYRIILPDGADSIAAMKKLSLLSEEDPMLRLAWNGRTQEIELCLMGEVQTEVLKELISERFGMEVEIGAGRLVYKESIAAPVIGYGHFEPLKHYAEVQLLMEPLPEGSGMEFCSLCSTDELDAGWQRVVLSALKEKGHIGVLTGSPVTDIKVSLIAGRVHPKHTESGDMRQAAFRAMRQGLMSAENVLLEPYYDYTLEVPSEYIGRAISDCNAMACSFTAPRDSGSGMILEGRGPAAELQCYTAELLSYTRGRGRLSCKFAGHFSCHNAEKIIEESGYEAERDCENIADSVFFSHGAGVNVKWDKAPEFMHVDSGIRLGEEGAELAHAPELIRGNISIDDKELEAVMRREFGEAKLPQTAAFTVDFGGRGKKRAVIKKDYLIIDGYNIIYAWDELKELARTSLEAARARLLELLVTYRAYKGSELCVVFDGYKLKGNPGSKGDEHGVHVVYTREGESADVYIEALMRDIGQNHAVRVASSDGMIQLCALRFGLVRVSARELEHEFDATFGEIEGILRSSGLKKLSLADIARLREKA